MQGDILNLFTKDLFGERRRGLRGGILAVLGVCTFLMALAAAAMIVARFGFRLAPARQAFFDEASRWVTYGFIAQAALKILLEKRRLPYLRERWFEYLLVVLLLAVFLFPDWVGRALLLWNPLLTADSLANVYLAVAELSLFAAFLPGAVRASRRLMSLDIQPSLLIVLSFLILVLLGSGLLMLPRCTVSGSMSFLDALFTAVSAGCVTGLTVVDVGTYFTPLGKGVLLLLIQVGGLGIMTFTTFFSLLLGGRGDLKEYATLQAVFGEEGTGRIRGVALQIALVTLAFEAGGAFLLFTFQGNLDGRTLSGRIFFAVFHSVSAFCNAGFSLFASGLSHPLLGGNAGFLATVMVLITAGGLGFPVLLEIGRAVLPRRRRAGRPRFSLHARIVLFMSSFLVLGGAAAFAALERDGAFAGMTPPRLVLHALFQSVTARTAGFNTVDIGALAAPASMLLMALMWIGASPGSTGGGVKTTAIALVLLDLRALARGRDRVEVLRARIDPDSIKRAHAVVLTSLLYAAAAFSVLTLTERLPMRTLLFETVSAMGTVGLSMGATARLSAAGKAVIVACMFVGRVGFLTALMAFTRRARRTRVDYASQSVPVL